MSPIDISHLNSDPDLVESFAVMQALRPHWQDCDAFMRQIRRQMQQQCYRMLAARCEGKIAGIAGYRVLDNLLYGHFLYVDDLVVCDEQQNAGIGAELMRALRDQALAQACQALVLDTGLSNALAQRFYFRHGLLAKGLHFYQPLHHPDAMSLRDATVSGD